MSDAKYLDLKAEKLTQHLADRYEVLSTLGQGGMGVVYKARHRLLKKLMAIKMMLGASVAEYELQRFEQEARAASKLSHPNIIVIHDFGITPESDAYLVMDYIDGLNLEDVFDKCGHLELQRFLRIFSQVCKALNHAHRNGVIHRDVKESNVMLVDTQEESDLVKVVDFGLAKIITPDRGQTLTEEGTVIGSPLFMAPELCKGQKADARCDIYSLGCLMYRAATGHYPFVGETGIDTMSMHIHQAPRSFADLASELNLPSELERAILKSMEKDPDKRQQSMDELESDITRAIESVNPRSSKDRGNNAAAKTKEPSAQQSSKNVTKSWAANAIDWASPRFITTVALVSGVLAVFVLLGPLLVKHRALDDSVSHSVDNSFSHKTDDSAASGTAVQLLRDPGFEKQMQKNISQPWSTEGKGLFGVDHNGNMHHGKNNAWIRTNKGWNAIKQRVILQANTSYALSCWLRDSGNLEQGQLGVRDSTGKTLAWIPFSRLHSYTHLSQKFNSENNSELEIFAGFEAQGHDTWLQLDDFSLKQTSEPAKH